MSSEHDSIHSFSDIAPSYASARPAYPATLFRRLAELAPERRAAWDCGTGSGQAAMGLVEFFAHVEATDASAAQIAQAPPHPRIRYAASRAESSGLGDRSVDVISVAQALHWFDRDGFFAEVRRVARPGALLAAFGYSWFYVAPKIDELTNRWLLQPIESFWMPNNRLLWEGYRTLAFPFEEVTAPSLAIHLTWTLEQLFDYYLTWPATQRKIGADGAHFVDEARAAFGAAWGGLTDARAVVMPLCIRLGRLP